MNRKAIKTDHAPGAIGPYSQGILANGFLYTAGQIPLTPAGQMVQGDIQAQARRCMENLRGILRAAGAEMEDLVKVTVFVTNLGDFQAINQVYGEYFKGKTPPARSFVQVSALPRGASIEVEGIAVPPVLKP